MKNKTSKMKRFKESMGVIGRICRDARPITWQLLLAAVISLVSVALAMLAPRLVGALTNEIYLHCTGERALVLADFGIGCALLLLIYLSSSVMSTFTMALMNSTVSRHYTCRIRVEMSAKISRIPVKTVDTTPNGEIISRMTNDVSIMGGTIHDIFNIIINGVIKLAVLSVVIFLANPIMALLIIFFVPAAIILSAILAARSEKYFNESRAASGKIYSLTEENLTGFDTVKAFNLEERQQKEYDKIAEDYRVKSKKSYILSGIIQPLVVLTNNIAYIAICVVGGFLAINGELEVGDLVAFVLYAQLFAGPLESISSGMSMIQSTLASARRVYEFLDGEELSELPFKGREAAIRGEVVFDNVSFSYKEDAPLIESFNLRVNPGEKVAIVGPTGGGKTTVVNLLMRFYDPKSGRILVDGADTAKMNRQDVRAMFGMVLQDTVLFSGTVYDNIAYGKEGATREEVMRAAERAHIDFFIDSLPKGYETEINEESTNISGGQKQLLTIARAYLSDRPILILDEATSNVDTRTEMLIQKTMDDLMRGRTSFVIAHRLSTVENADVILVVDGGKIVEQGTHNELLRRDGLYAKIYKSQYVS